MIEPTAKMILVNEEEMQTLASNLAKAIPHGAVIYLEGPLGAGKTTFARGFMRGLGWMDKVKSPTFTIVEPYEVDERTIFHFDLYRLTNPHELEEMGVREYFTQENICLIEWPDKGLNYLPTADIRCVIKIMDEEREVILKAISERGEEIIRLLNA